MPWLAVPATPLNYEATLHMLPDRHRHHQILNNSHRVVCFLLIQLLHLKKITLEYSAFGMDIRLDDICMYYGFALIASIDFVQGVSNLCAAREQNFDGER